MVCVDCITLMNELPIECSLALIMIGVTMHWFWEHASKDIKGRKKSRKENNNIIKKVTQVTLA